MTALSNLFLLAAEDIDPLLSNQFLRMYVFVLAGFVGFQIITKVPALLHTPLMSATNAISGISLVGSLVAAGAHYSQVSTVLGFLAVTAATINVVGGFMITDRMLKMFKRQERKQVMPASALLIALGMVTAAEPAATAASGASELREFFIQAAYLAASVLFILGLRGLTAPDKARRGMQLAAIGMLVAVVGTLIDQRIVEFQWIILGLVIGSGIGAAISIWMPMTAVPQRTAISHAFGALAATLVGISHYHYLTQVLHEQIGGVEMAALGFEVMFGSLTITGSLMAFGKLQELLPSAPITYKFQNELNIGLFVVAVCMFGYLVFTPSDAASHAPVFYLMVVVGLAVGVLIVVPIGGADMPVVISLLNSYAGLASSATGFALGNNVLIIAGALDGASGFLLSILMSKAMNRSFSNVLFGAFGGATTTAASTSVAGLTVRSVSVEDAAAQLAYAREVIVVPGYGMAVAQAQHQVRELAELIEKRGGEVKFAIHPVAGRMPGHMNVLLAEANVAYDKLFDMDDINGEFSRADVALVIGANDVVNPAARNDPSSPIYGMPILNADQAKSVIVLKRSMNPGFAGIENELFYDHKCSLLFGDAKSSLTKLVGAVKTA